MNILDIFYKNIILEASVGEIDSFFKYNIIFSTDIVEDSKKIEAVSNNDNLLIPTLRITNKEEFNKLLEEYVREAMSFYHDDNYPTEILNHEIYNEEKRICKEKTIIATLFSNATIEDFNNPCEFLRKRINFFNSTCEESFELGHSELLHSDIHANIKKDSIYNECPYEFSIVAKDDSNLDYYFPNIKFGICDGVCYIYAIQKGKEENTSKIVNRALYKTGEGFDHSLDNEEIYGSGNLKDISSSFLVSLNIFISYLASIGIREVKVPSILIERWNAKEIANQKRLDFNIDNEESYIEKEDKHIDIQTNLTEKLLRTFLRLSSHYESIKITSFPNEIDTFLSLNVDNLDNCNNSLLRETSNLIFNKIKVK